MSLKSLIQCWGVIAVGGMIGLTAIAWNGSYEKGSAIDIIKTHALESHGGRR